MRPPRGVIVTGGTGALWRAVVRRLLDGGARVAIPFRGKGAGRATEPPSDAVVRIEQYEGFT